jgi:hypothetical protein
MLELLLNAKDEQKMLNYMNKDLTINFKDSMGSIIHIIFFLITSQNQFIS